MDSALNSRRQAGIESGGQLIGESLIGRGA